MTKKDIINELQSYIEVLEFDIKHSDDQQSREVLGNVIVSLTEIINKSK